MYKLNYRDLIKLFQVQKLKCVTVSRFVVSEMIKNDGVSNGA